MVAAPAAPGNPRRTGALKAYVHFSKTLLMSRLNSQIHGAHQKLSTVQGCLLCHPSQLGPLVSVTSNQYRITKKFSAVL